MVLLQMHRHDGVMTTKPGLLRTTQLEKSEYKTEVIDWPHRLADNIAKAIQTHQLIHDTRLIHNNSSHKTNASLQN